MPELRDVRRVRAVVRAVFDGEGDACDNDGIDNCPRDANPGQENDQNPADPAGLRAP